MTHAIFNVRRSPGPMESNILVTVSSCAQLARNLKWRLRVFIQLEGNDDTTFTSRTYLAAMLDAQKHREEPSLGSRRDSRVIEFSSVGAKLEPHSPLACVIVQ